MRLLRVGPAGAERPAAPDADDIAHDLTPLTAAIAFGAYPRAGDVVEAGIDGLGRRRHVVGHG